MPGDAGMPSRITDTLRSLLPELPVNEAAELGQRLGCVVAHGADRDLTTVFGREHHDAHDALTVHFQIVLLHPQLGSEPAGELDELGRGSRVQPVAVLDLDRSLEIGRLRHHTTSLRMNPRTASPA